MIDVVEVSTLAKTPKTSSLEVPQMDRDSLRLRLTEAIPRLASDPAHVVRVMAAPYYPRES